MRKVNREGEVWVFAEQIGGKLHEVSLELCGRAQQLAKTLGVKAAAVLPGSAKHVEGLPEQLIAHGADKVYIIADPLLDHYQTNTYAEVLCQMVRKHEPQILVYGATPLGRDLAPRVASEVESGLTADCTDLQIQNVTEPKTKVEHDNLLLQIRPAFGGNIVATIVNFDWWPQMATVREGVMPMLPADLSRKGEIVEEKLTIDPMLAVLKLIEHHTEERKVNLKASRIIVSGGGGLGGPDGFAPLFELAGAMGGVVGSSRAAVNAGWIGHEHLVGQTGTSVRPALYIACGISGAIQHRAGMENSSKIIAINTDPDAPILGLAHYAIIGDFREIVPMMTKAVKAKE